MSDEEWREFVARELQLRFAFGRSEDLPSGEKLRTWWRAVSDVLTAYARSEGRYTFPPDLASALGGVLGYVAVGKVPGPIKDAGTEGATGFGPTERRHIGIAVAYIAAAKDGITHNGEFIRVKDRRPIKTVTEKFGVARSTVQSWGRNYEPAFLGINDINAEVLSEMMEQAGEFHRNAGRSHTAIDRRGRK